MEGSRNVVKENGNDWQARPSNMASADPAQLIIELRQEQRRLETEIAAVMKTTLPDAERLRALVNSITEEEYNEFKSFAGPVNDQAELALGGACRIFGFNGVEKHQWEESGEHEETARKLVYFPVFKNKFTLQQLKENMLTYDCENTAQHIIKELSDLMDNEDYTLEKMSDISPVCEALCAWGIWVKKTYRASWAVRPLRFELKTVLGKICAVKNKSFVQYFLSREQVHSCK